MQHLSALSSDLGTEEGGYHFSLIQNAGKLETPEEIARAERELKEIIPEVRKIFIDSAKKYEATHHQKPSCKVSFRTHSLDLKIPASSIMVNELPVLSYFLDASGKARVTPVLNWAIVDPATGLNKRLELNTADLMAGKSQPFDTEVFVSGVKTGYQQFDPMDMNEFLGQLSPRMRELYSKNLPELPPSRYPSIIRGKKGRRVLVTNQTTSVLKPARAFAVFDTVSKMGLTGTQNTETGLTLYASTGDGEVQYPGDWDLLASSLVFVPSDQAKTKEEARNAAAKIFYKEVLGQIREKILSGAISVIEFRVSSKAAMGYSHPEDLEGYEENLFLTEVHFLEGKYTDERGKVWPLEELIEHGDFTKFKLNFWRNGKAHEISLQFLIGYIWNGEAYPLQTANRKGQLPMLRTGIAMDEGTLAIASILHRAFVLYAIQKGQIEWSAIRELNSFWLKLDRNESHVPVSVNPVLPAKIAKKVRGLVRLILGMNPAMGEVFFKETREVLRRSGRWTENYSYGDLYVKLLQAVNQKELKSLNDFERKVNDLRELNEGKHEFDEKTMNATLKDTVEFISWMDKLLLTPELTKPEGFLDDYRNFKGIISKATGLDSFEKQSVYLKNTRPGFHSALLAFESQLKLVQDFFVRNKLGAQEQNFIHVLMSHLTHFYMRYITDRTSPTEGRQKLMLKMMGISPSPANLQIMQYIVVNLDTMKHEELAELQKQLFASTACADVLSAHKRPSEPPPSSNPSF